MTIILPPQISSGSIQSLIDGDPVGDIPDDLLSKYQACISDLRKIGITASGYGLTFTLSSEPALDFHFNWDAHLPGIWITFSKDGHPRSTLLGFPLTSISTGSYGPYFFGGEPPAARLLTTTEHLMIFVSDTNSPPDELLAVLSTQPDPESPSIPEAVTELHGTLLEVEVGDPVCVDCPASPGREEVLDIAFNDLEGILLVGFVTSGYPMKEFVAKSEWE